MAFKDMSTELTLAPPGGEIVGGSAAAVNSGHEFSSTCQSCNTSKRGFVETDDYVDVHDDLLSSTTGEAAAASGGTKSTGSVNDKSFEAEATSRIVAEAPPAKAQVIGWPPVRSFRKKALESCNKYVKVAADGAPYLRKIDLEIYHTYHQFLTALEEMFSTNYFIIRSGMNSTCINIGDDQSNKLFKAVKGIEYVPTYEDKDDDLMLVGDVPWKMFTESCKRIRLMKSSEAVGLAARTSPGISK